MRKLMRSIARHNMEKAGIVRKNKPQHQNGKSYFSLHWREYVS